jgi:hypothetical protein
MKPVYNVNYFISKFEAIPEESWTILTLCDDQGRRCALGHCGVTKDPVTQDEIYTQESEALVDIFAVSTNYPNSSVALINDGLCWMAPGEETPKKRILAALALVRKEILNDVDWGFLSDYL